MNGAARPREDPLVKISVSTRIYRAIFLISFPVVILALTMAVYEVFEDIILHTELAREREFYRQQIDRPDYQEWKTASLTVAFLGDGQPESRLPAVFRGLQPPFSAEIELTDEAYLVSVERVRDPEGTLYLAQDITAIEDLESLAQFGIIVLGLLMIGLLLSFSRLAARWLIQPLQRLTREIQQTSPGKAMRRLSTDYEETEYIDIASAFNRFLDALESFVEREETFVKLASHELQTPVAVISGALDVLERRNRLSPEDRHTLSRIRRTATEMQADVEVLLKLARNAPEADAFRPVNVVETVLDVIGDLEDTQPARSGRASLLPQSEPLIIRTDPALLRMLLRNLIQNALKHTRSRVQILVGEDGVRLTDFGGGLPDAVMQRLREPAWRRSRNMGENSFGLLIAQLICERLHWTLDVARSDRTGTDLVIRFDGQRQDIDGPPLS